MRNLVEIGDITTLLIIRLAAEGSLCRIEIANARTEDINRYHNRSLWVETAKRVRGRHAKQSRMRQRNIPLNISLFSFIQRYVDFNQKYILERKGRGDDNKNFHPQHLNYFVAKKNNLPFTIQHCRHYFKSQVWQWMIRNKQPDIALCKELMGHQKTVHERYGVYPWAYKLELVDKVFVTDQFGHKDMDINNLRDAIANGVAKGIIQIEIRKGSHSFITDWVSEVMKQFTPSDLYLAIINNYDICSDDLRLQILQYKEYLNPNMVLQLIKEDNLALYSTIINTPNGILWIRKQLENIKSSNISSNQFLIIF